MQLIACILTVEININALYRLTESIINIQTASLKDLCTQKIKIIFYNKSRKA